MGILYIIFFVNVSMAENLQEKFVGTYKIDRSDIRHSLCLTGDCRNFLESIKCLNISGSPSNPGGGPYTFNFLFEKEDAFPLPIDAWSENNEVLFGAGTVGGDDRFMEIRSSIYRKIEMDWGDMLIQFLEHKKNEFDVLFESKSFDGYYQGTDFKWDTQINLDVGFKVTKLANNICN